MLLGIGGNSYSNSNRQMDILETKTKSGLLRAEERLVGMVLRGQTLVRYPGRSA